MIIACKFQILMNFILFENMNTLWSVQIYFHATKEMKKRKKKNLLRGSKVQGPGLVQEPSDALLDSSVASN